MNKPRLRDTTTKWRYEEQYDDALSLRNDATKKRDIHEFDTRAVLGPAASYLVSRLPGGTPVEGGQHIPDPAFSSRRAFSTRRRTEDEARSPRVADSSGPVCGYASV